MADDRQPSQLIDALEDYTDEYYSASSAYNDNANVLRFLNAEQKALVRDISSRDRGWFLAHADYDIVANQREYALPDDLETIKTLEILNGNTTNSNFRGGLISILPFSDRSAVEIGVNTTRLPWGQVTLRDNYLYVMPLPTSSLTNAWRLHYIKKPIDMATGTASAGGDDYITLPASATLGTIQSTDRYYVNAKVITTGGTGSGQIRTCEAYTGSTRKLEVSENWSPNPDSTTTFEILSQLPANHLEVLLLGASRRLASRDADRQGWQANWRQDYEEAYNRLMKHVNRRQVQQAATRQHTPIH